MALPNIDRVSLNNTSNGSRSAAQMQGTEHLTPRTLGHLPPELPLRQRVKDTLRKGWMRVVRKPADDKYSASQKMVLTVLAALLVFFGTAYWRAQDTNQRQHDEIIILRTKLEMEEKKNIDQDSKIDQARNQAEVARSNVSRLEGKFDQFALTFSIKNADKANLQLDRE